MTDAEFRSRYEALGTIIEGSGITTQLVRDRSRVIRMAHSLGAEGGAGGVRLRGLSRLREEAEAQIVERCLVDGNWVVITRNLDDFVDFESWVASKETKLDPFATDIFGPRVDGPRKQGAKPGLPENAVSQNHEQPRGPRPTEVLGPELLGEVNSARPGEAAEVPPKRPAPQAAVPAGPREVSPPTRDARPRVFWRDLEDRSVLQKQPDEVPAKPEQQVAAPEHPTPSAESAVHFPTPVSSYRAPAEHEEQKAPPTPRTLLQSLPRIIPLPRRGAGGEKFTQVVSGRPQRGLGEAEAESQPEDDSGAGVPKWLIITMAVVAVLAIVLIIIGVVT